MEDIKYKYRFKFKDGSEKIFETRFDPVSLDIITEKQAEYPEWTLLTNFRCPNCPLEASGYCPVITNLLDVISSFKDSLSFEETEMYIETPERTYVKSTSLQQGLNAIVGVYMPTSGCPILSKLKPMVRFHLPFANLEETNYRMISMYVTAQYLKERDGTEADWELKGLTEIYEDVRIINKNICERLRAVEFEDASINALVMLDCFAFSVSFSIKQKLEDIKKMFSEYLN